MATKLNFVAIKYTKRPYYISNGHKIYQIFSFQGYLKYTQIGSFGIKICHLANLAGHLSVVTKIGANPSDGNRPGLPDVTQTGKNTK
jgi:hypothetical protein